MHAFGGLFEPALACLAVCLCLITLIPHPPPLSLIASLPSSNSSLRTRSPSIIGPMAYEWGLAILHTVRLDG
ncbi:hypothetical protein BJX66DRAFT_317248 [Aspergillus keveii]|uniref:Secreted protein n=1 Tax=Aspergillus keveii TaxID=714993 RepID=A0ABR4FLI5_9EURO